MMQENIIPLFIVIPLAGAFLTSLLGKRIKWLPDIFGALSTFILFLLSLLSVRLVNIYGTLVHSVGGWRPPIGIAMVLDNLTAFMLVTVNFVVLMILKYAVS